MVQNKRVMNFLEWNDAITTHFFRPEASGRTVYLYVTEDLIEHIGGAGTVHEFVAVMKGGPTWSTRQGLCQRALQSLEGWRNRSLEYPPYVGYLALFVLAAGIEGEFAPHAYYPRLRTLLGEPATMGIYPSFGRMLELWSDLEQWLNHERRGTLGVLRTDIAGAWLHVGLPIAQSILTESERQHLHRIFDDAGLDPEFPPGDLELARLVHAADHGLRTRTKSALESPQSEYGAVLIDRVLDELEAWSGAQVANSGSESDGPTERRGAVVVCLSAIDEVARRVVMHVRCRFTDPFPAGVRVSVKDREFTCEEAADGLSTPFVDASGEKLNAASVDWERSTLLGVGLGPALRWFASLVRIFVDGRERGLPGFIEAQSLDPFRPFVIAVHPRIADALRAWGQSSCHGFEELSATGMPPDWVLFRARGAADDALIRDIAPRLGFAKQLRRIKTVGGIRVPGEQNSYFRFAPPSIRLEGCVGDTPVTIGGVRLSRQDDGAFQIPEELLTENILVVEAMTLRRVVYLQDSAIEPDWNSCGRQSDGEPQLSSDAEDHLPFGPPPSAIAAALPMEVGPVVARGVRVRFIGRRPGEIADTAPPFETVWMITQRGRDEYSVDYVASELCEPLAGKASNARAVREWKALLWNKRKQIRGPEFGPLRRLFKAYQGAARNV